MKRALLKVLVIADLLVGIGSAVAADHVRVILDTSGSMLSNDAPRLAALSTLLLRDLADPNLTTGDTFQVIAFEPSGEAWTGGRPPSAVGPRIVPTPGNRDAFVNAVKALPYNASHTYYYPVLNAAISDLTRAGSTADRRVIVLVTDGVPEDPDPGLIQRELVPQLSRQNIQLYVLALGPRAASQSRTIQDTLGGTAVGDLFVDVDGSRLTEHMIEIFSRSFGYTADNSHRVNGPVNLDLEGGQTPQRVAVVVYWKNRRAPQLRLRPPVGGLVNNPEGVLTAEELGVSYAVTWALSPGRGPYELAGDSTNATAVVLRPAGFLVEVQTTESGQIHSTMAQTQFPLKLLVTPPGGIRDFRGTVELAYRLNGPQKPGGYAWSGNWEAPTGLGTITGRGLTFQIFPIFPANRSAPQDNYEGYLTVEIRRRQAVVGSLSGDHAHRVLVYPYMRLQPSPEAQIASVNGQARALQRREKGCAQFTFSLQGELPHPGTPDYSLRAVLDPRMASDPRLGHAQFRLDGEVLEYDAPSSLHRGQWYSGRHLSRERMLGTHEVCLQVGKPKDVEAGRPVELAILFNLIETPYDKMATITPFTLKALIAQPAFMEKYAAWLALGLGLLTTLLLLWYGRYRPELPSDLVFMASREGSSNSRTEMGKVSPVRRLLGMTVERPVFTDNGSFILGYVSPVDDDLYLFRSGAGINVHTLDGGTVEYRNGRAKLSVNRDYRANSDRDKFRIRAEYR